MKKKNINLISLLVLLGILLMLTNSCIKPEFPVPHHHEYPPSIPVLTTTEVSLITLYTATSGGNIISDEGLTIITRGVCWSTDSVPTIADSKTIDDSGIGTFVSEITGLDANTKYYVRAYATNSDGIGYGNCKSFSTYTTIFGPGYRYLGGIIAYILQSGDPGYVVGETHGIIAAPRDENTTVDWSNESFVTTNATATALGSGNANTNTIIAIQGKGSYAAILCYDLVVGGYNDWYLPSKDELTKLYLNKDVIGCFTGKSYWSSSETGNSTAWRRSFTTGIEYDNWKATIYNVRAVRSF